MRILVTGAAGLLGHAVVPLLHKRGHYVIQCEKDVAFKSASTPISFIADLSSEEGAGAAIRLSRPDAVVHLAGRRAAVAKQYALAADLLLDNLAIDISVFRAMRKYGVKRGVYASTVSVYPSVGRLDADAREEDADCFPDDSVRFSACAKLTAERAIEAMNLQDGAQVSIVRLVNTYGPHDNFGPDALVIPALIRRFLSETKPELSSPDYDRDVLFVADAARGIVAALEHPTAGIWNLGTGVSTKVRDIADVVAEAVGRPHCYTTSSSSSDYGTGARRKVVDPSKAQRELGWGATTSLVDGVRRTVEWYRTGGSLNEEA